MSVKSLVKYIYILLSAVFILYMALPGPDYPEAPPESLQSDEPGDTEDPSRRAYFTNLTRDEVMDHYTGQFISLEWKNINLPTYRLNYPPEEAQIIIKDQTRSTFLEEIVHPLRESVYVNGFEPKKEKDAIIIQDRLWRQKITVRYVKSSAVVRLVVAGLVILVIPILYSFWSKTVKILAKEAGDIWRKK